MVVYKYIRQLTHKIPFNVYIASKHQHQNRKIHFLLIIFPVFSVTGKGSKENNESSKIKIVIITNWISNITYRLAPVPTFNFYFLFLAMVPLTELSYSSAIARLKWNVFSNICSLLIPLKGDFTIMRENRIHNINNFNKGNWASLHYILLNVLLLLNWISYIT